MFLVRSSLAKAVYALHFLTCASSAITPQPITVYFFSLLSQSQVLNCCGVLRLTLIVRNCFVLFVWIVSAWLVKSCFKGENLSFWHKA